MPRLIETWNSDSCAGMNRVELWSKFDRCSDDGSELNWVQRAFSDESCWCNEIVTELRSGSNLNSIWAWTSLVQWGLSVAIPSGNCWFLPTFCMWHKERIFVIMVQYKQMRCGVLCICVYHRGLCCPLHRNLSCRSIEPFSCIDTIASLTIGLTTRIKKFSKS